MYFLLLFIRLYFVSAPHSYFNSPFLDINGIECLLLSFFTICTSCVSFVNFGYLFIGITANSY